MRALLVEVTTTLRSGDGSLPAGVLELGASSRIEANLGHGRPFFSEGWVDGVVRGTFLGYEMTA